MAHSNNLENISHIIEGCKKQDKLSQEKLYRQFYPALYTLCKTFFEDKHDIVTAVNNGMLNVYKNIEQYNESKGAFFNWVYTVVRNASLTLIRDKKSYLTFELNDNLKEHTDNNPFKLLEWKDIYFYLDQLPPKTRCVCSLYYLEGFSINEISEAIDMKEGTVKWHLSESRNRLKFIFEKHNFKIG